MKVFSENTQQHQTVNTVDLIDDPLLDRRDLKKRFPHLPNSANHLRRLEAKGWPPPIRISARRRVWRLSAVLAYLRRKEVEALLDSSSPTSKG
jgi:hypothetical protein